jgi:hypothetical protein
MLLSGHEALESVVGPHHQKGRGIESEGFPSSEIDEKGLPPTVGWQTGDEKERLLFATSADKSAATTSPPRGKRGCDEG